MTTVIVNQFMKELEAEALATRKCLERIPESMFSWKPHEKSMSMLNLVTIVADIPRWVTFAIEKGEVNFATYPQLQIKTTDDVVMHFDKNMTDAKTALGNLKDEDLTKVFSLKRGDEVLTSASLGETISSTLNHWVHHRGQLSVFMRLKDLPVPSIYGPSADEKIF
jgi:uncharacterized damage-inducible protein DinB